MPHKKSSSFPWGVILKILVSTSLIVWLLGKIDLTEVWSVIQNLSGHILIGVLIIVWLTLCAVAKRWQFILELREIKPPFRNLLESTFIGAFFNQILPSSVGGDFYRVLAVRPYGASLSEGTSSVFMDRLFGFISLGILCIFVVPLEWPVLMNSALKWPFLVTLSLLAGTSFGGGLFFLIPSSWLHHSFLKPFLPFIEMTRQIFRHKESLLTILFSSFVASSLLIFGIQLLLMAFDIPLTWRQSMAVLPVVILLTSLPISFAGWGLREGTMIMAFSQYGIPQETALAVSLVYGVLQLISGLPGLILWLLKKKKLKI